MADYGFVHEGRVFTPNGSQGLDASKNEERNNIIDRAELDLWATRPEKFVAYYDFPQESVPVRAYRHQLAPNLTGAKATTWLGAVLGAITKARVYRNNLGSRTVSITVDGNNGATYHGRASWDNGTVIRLRKSKS